MLYMIRMLEVRVVPDLSDMCLTLPITLASHWMTPIENMANRHLELMYTHGAKGIHSQQEYAPERRGGRRTF